MHGKRRGLVMIVAAAAVIALGLWFLQHLRDRRESAKRESGYKTLLAKYAIEFKPGMTRDEVERHLQTDGTRFSQMCCVALYSGKPVSFAREGYDDLVKIGQESAPSGCSEPNVYIAFEFYPKSPGERSGTNASDILKAMSVSHQLEDCM